MKRISTSTKGMVLACTALALAFAGCTSSDQPSTGGLDAELIVSGNNANASVIAEHISDVYVTIACLNGDGTDPTDPAIDPISGEGWPPEGPFRVNVDTTGNQEPGKPLIGLFKKEGLPPNSTCTITVVAESDNGDVTCGGQGSVEIEVLANGENKFIQIPVSCITAARYGGVGVDGRFNRCMEYQQIIVSPLDQLSQNWVDVDIWCYDPDGDNGAASIFFVKDNTNFQNNPGNPMAWDTCTADPINLAPNVTDPHQPYVYTCNTQDPPINVNAPHVDAQVQCFEVAQCVTVITVSDDDFGLGGTDPFGCNGVDPLLSTPGNPVHDWNAYAEIKVDCQGTAVCGDNIAEGPEECDLPGVNALEMYGDSSGNTSGGTAWGPAWCDTNCKIFDPCAPANQDSYPASCPAPAADPVCAPRECNSTTTPATPTCGNVNEPDTTACDDPNGTAGNLDWFCDGSGTCAAPPQCDSNNDIDSTDPTAGNSDCGVDAGAGMGVSTECMVFECDSQSQCQTTNLTGNFCASFTGFCQDPDASGIGTCTSGTCTNPNDLPAFTATYSQLPSPRDDWGWLVAVCSGAEGFGLAGDLCYNLGTCNDPTDPCADATDPSGGPGWDTCCSGAATCIETCLEAETTPSINNACSACYGNTTCSASCALPCGIVNGPGSLECDICNYDLGCTQILEACTGLLTPTPAGCTPGCTTPSCCP